MPELVLLGGPPGVGKSTVLACLGGRLPGSALLDADDVWRVSPDLANDRNGKVAIGNVVSVMRGYFEAGCGTGILAWVFARPELYQPVIDGLKDQVGSVRMLYLTAEPAALKARLNSRGEDHKLDYALDRLALIRSLPFSKIDTTQLSPAEVADAICDRLGSAASPAPDSHEIGASEAGRAPARAGGPQEESRMLKGSCACGTVRFEIDGQLVGPVSYCHCWRCRKHSGSSFGTTANVHPADFRIVSGDAHLRYWESSPGVKRYFAGCCGSPIYKMGEGDTLGFRLGTLDCDPGVQVEVHYMIDARAPWAVIDDVLPREAAGEGPFDYLNAEH